MSLFYLNPVLEETNEAKGYGWLPYDYVKNKLAVDFWSLNSMEWVDTRQFGL